MCIQTEYENDTCYHSSPDNQSYTADGGIQDRQEVIRFNVEYRALPAKTTYLPLVARDPSFGSTFI